MSGMLDVMDINDFDRAMAESEKREREDIIKNWKNIIAEFVNEFNENFGENIVPDKLIGVELIVNGFIIKFSDTNGRCWRYKYKYFPGSRYEPPDIFDDLEQCMNR